MATELPSSDGTEWVDRLVFSTYAAISYRSLSQDSVSSHEVQDGGRSAHEHQRGAIITRRPRSVEKLKTDQLSVEVYATRDDMGIAAGQAVAGCMRALLREKDRIRMVFAAAPSQNEFLAELSSLSDLDWQRVTALHMDEYVGIGANAPQSFVRYLREHLYDRVKPGVVHSLDGSASDPMAECERYANLLGEAPIDIVCAGIGENGHLAFNDPPDADFDAPETVKVVNLALACREQQVHDGCFPDLGSVPKRALTLTIPALMAATYVFCVVPGPTKAGAVRDTLLGPVSALCPATVLRRHSSAIVYLDTDSARLFRS